MSHAKLQEAKDLLRSSYHVNWLAGLRIKLQLHAWVLAWPSLVMMDVWNDVVEGDDKYELPATWTDDIAAVIMEVDGAREALMRQALDDKLGRRGQAQATVEYAERLHEWLKGIKKVGDEQG